MLQFYKYVFYKLYSFFERLKSRNPYNTASGLLTIPVGILIFKIHRLILRYAYNTTIQFENIVIEYLVIFFMLYVINYFVLIHNMKYLLIEDYFKQKEYPKHYDKLIILLLVLFVISMIL